MVEEGRETHADSSEPSEEGRSFELDKLQSQTAALRDLLEFLAQNLVTRPESVHVTESRNDDQCVLELRVDKEDLGRVIGKQGRTARSVRTLLGAAGMKLNRRFTLEILE